LFARASLGKQPSAHDKAAPPVKAQVQPESWQQQRSLEESTAPRFPWNIGDIALSAPGRHVGRLAWPIQAKLEVGVVDDPLEREADRVAEHVMRTPDPATSDERLQRKCSCGGSCDTCKAEQADEEHGKLQRKSAAPGIPAFSSTPAAALTAPPVVDDVLHSPGQPLDNATRRYFEPRFQFDFNHVRIHTDAPAGASARAVNAQAYTVGSHIVLGSGTSGTRSPASLKLIAHELAHVVQQGQGRPLARHPEPVLQRQKAGQPDEPLDVALARQEAAEQLEERSRAVLEQFQAGQVPSTEHAVEVGPFFVQEDPLVRRIQQQMASGHSEVPKRLERLRRSLRLAAKAYFQQVEDADALKKQIAFVELVNSFIPALLRDTEKFEALLQRQKATEGDVADTMRFLNFVRRDIEDTKQFLPRRAADLRQRVYVLVTQARFSAQQAGVTGDTAASVDQLPLLRTIIEGSPTLMSYLRQQREQRTQPTDLRNRQNFTIHQGKQDFRDAVRQARIEPAERGYAIGGFYDQRTDAIHLPRDSKFGHALHEAIHKYSPTTRCAKQLDPNTVEFRPSSVALCNCGEFLNEGLTQYFADIVLRDQGLPKFTGHAYGPQLACATRFVDTYHLDSVARLYFLNDSQGALNQFVQSKQCANFCAGGPAAAVRRKPAETPMSSQRSSAPPIVDAVLRSPGQPLDRATLGFFEPRFGQRLHHVRVHANAQAAESASAIGAMAYTVGPDIVFGRGRFSPNSLSGRSLLAHELAHVLQQPSASPGTLRRTPCLHGSDCTFIPGDTGRFVDRLHTPTKVTPSATLEVVEGHPEVQTPDVTPPPSRQGELATNVRKLVEESGFTIPSEASGPFIDEGLSARVGAQAPLCSEFPGGVPKGAPKDGCCIQIYPEMESRAKRLRESKTARTQAEQRDALALISTVLHEAEHCHFNKSPETAKKIPGESDCNLDTVVFHGPGTGADFKVKYYLSELSARIAEFAPYFQNYDASPTKENHDLLHQKEIEIALNKDESLRGIIHGLQCACSCESVDHLVENAVRNAMSSWPKGQARKFLEVMARMLPSWWPKGLRSL
jgi:hypothetical protein